MRTLLDSINLTQQETHVDYLWQLYERQAENLFKLIPNAKVERDAREEGLISKRRRQLDIRITFPIRIEISEYFEIEVPVKIIADCKHYKRAIDITTLGKIIALKDDVRADLAIVVTPHGIADSARVLAKNSHVFPLTLTSDLMTQVHGRDYEVTCLTCEGFPNYVYWATYGLDKPPLPPREGNCEYCGALHICCPDCLTIFSFENNSSSILKCPQDCGAVFVFTQVERKSPDMRLDRTYDSLESTILLELNQRKTKRMTKGRVNAIISATKWQFWTVDSPLFVLTEDDLVEWRGDHLHLTRDGQEIVDHVLLKAEAADWFDSNAPASPYSEILVALWEQRTKVPGEQRSEEPD
jgi:hypothetical protein